MAINKILSRSEPWPGAKEEFREVYSEAPCLNPGVVPVKYRVIVYPDPVDKMTPGGLLEKPNEAIEAERMAQTEGVLAAVSEMAFSSDDGHRWRCRLPNIGDRVVFAKYQGQMFEGEDGREYRLMNDNDIVGVR